MEPHTRRHRGMQRGLTSDDPLLSLGAGKMFDVEEAERELTEAKYFFQRAEWLLGEKPGWSAQPCHAVGPTRPAHTEACEARGHRAAQGHRVGGQPFQ